MKANTNCYCNMQVNADIRKYVIGKDGNPKLFQVDTTSVGMTISTKAVGTQQREDITSLVRNNVKAKKAGLDLSYRF